MPETVSYVLEWDKTGEKLYESGVDHGVLYLPDAHGAYIEGHVWNGLTAVNEAPEGGEPNDQYADNIKYASLMSAEKYKATIEAFTYPEEFEQCDGSAEIAPGVNIGQQERKPFGFCYRTKIGNDTVGDDYGFKLHLVYGCKAQPSDQNHETVNDSPEAATMSWEVDATPVNVTGKKPTATLTINSLKADADKLAALLQILYGTPASGSAEAVAPRMPLPDEVATLMA